MSVARADDTATARFRTVTLPPAASYAVAVLIGVAAVVLLMPLAAVLGDGGIWASPSGDIAQNVTGHLALQQGGWRFPPLVAGSLMWPHGLSTAMTDSNPLMSLLGKLLAEIRGEPGNLMGFWLAACWILQPVGAVYVVRGFGARRIESALAAAVLAVCFPALLFRLGHINLCGHFILLLALGLTARMLAAGAGRVLRDWLVPCGLLTLAILSHPYLFVFAAALLASPVLRFLLHERAQAARVAGLYLAACVVPVLLYGVLSGALGGAEKGFGIFSMNLLSPVWPQMSGLFGPHLPVLDATGGQYEGFNYLGGGGLLLIGLAVLTAAWPHRHGTAAAPRRHGLRPLALVLMCLAVFSLSSRVYAGDVLLVSVLVKPLNQVFGVVQSSGRAFWPVGYALLLGAIAVLDRRLPRAALVAVLLVATGLQVADSRPLWAAAQAVLAGSGQAPPVIPIPPGARLLTIPSVCARDQQAQMQAATERYAAIRAGLALSDIKVSRLPRWFNCEIDVSDGTELPLREGEIRLFLEENGRARFRLAAMGPDAVCGQHDGMIACARGLGTIWPEPPPAGRPLPELAWPAPPLEGAALDPLRSFGWRVDQAGLAWSEGPRATLLFRLPAALAQSGAVIRLGLEGVGQHPGQPRPVVLHAGRADAVGPVATAALPDLRLMTVAVPVPPDAMQGGMVRIAIDIDHPVDPTARQMTAPVGRAGVRLVSLEVVPATAAGSAP